MDLALSLHDGIRSAAGIFVASWFGVTSHSQDVAGLGRASTERIAINTNRNAAGTLRHGVLTIRLEARTGEWHPDGENDPGLMVRAFAEEGKAPQIPGPLIRVPQGTEIHISVRNPLDSTLIVRGLSSHGASSRPGADTLQIKPGGVREVRFAADAIGTYYYWGSTSDTDIIGRPHIDSQLSGAFIVDGPGATRPPGDRILVIGLWNRNDALGGVIDPGNVHRFVINGRSWPNTERLAYTVGDSVRFRVLNTSAAVHPMHLHGFYFNVVSRGDGHTDSAFSAAGSPHLVVTERVAPGHTIALTWVPERAGNWLFHCHDNYHVLRNRPLDGSLLPPEQMLHPTNHALEMMGGLVMGIEVRPRAGAAAPAESGVRRKLRLVARVDSGGTDAEPAYGYVLQDGPNLTPATGPLLPGPTIVLKRNEPVSITVVNSLPEATAVHWHGIELESYYDGVAGFAGSPGHIAPVIAPRDSFEARFTPPRAGTFIYHPHADEVRQQQAGLSGALIVLDPRTTFDPERDVVLLLSTPRRNADRDVVLLNGTSTPSPREMRVGERYRLRLVDIHTYRPSMIARLVQDSTPVTWRAIAKDGMDLPPDQATSRRAVQQMGNGETYDFEFVPALPGVIRFTVSSGGGALLVAMPIRVR
jgi:FtsP/CotA-like multicopper oxidase with cupredoxin domain